MTVVEESSQHKNTDSQNRRVLPAALARFKATARGCTLALQSGLSMNSDQSLTRDEAADLLTNSLLAAAEGLEGSAHVEQSEEGEADVPVSPPHPPPATSPQQLSAILEQQPELSVSEAARALAVSRAVKVLRERRGCSAAEAIDELSGIMTDVCKIRNKSQISPARAPVRAALGGAAKMLSTKETSETSSSLPPNPMLFLASPPVIKKRRDFGGASGLSRISIATPSSRIPFTPVSECDTSASFLSSSSSSMSSTSTANTATASTTPPSAPPFGAKKQPRCMKQPRSLSSDLGEYHEDSGDEGGFVPGGKMRQHYSSAAKGKDLAHFAAAGGAKTKKVRRAKKIKSRALSPMRNPTHHHVGNKNKRNGNSDDNMLSSLGCASPKKRSRTISSEEAGFESP
ncbi:hypothetical protein TrST_g12231 [Triparma strigata]|uniref:Uncharacterized protein n=1 Tax=Triparma strigata TaxID=1606541 RepID=A0A9W7B9K1_9STRA|nr:hypothetical protein TrST_g12231 [Triparma strigata]